MKYKKNDTVNIGNKRGIIISPVEDYIANLNFSFGKSPNMYYVSINGKIEIFYEEEMERIKENGVS